jgi:hypothetical protein
LNRLLIVRFVGPLGPGNSTGNPVPRLQILEQHHALGNPLERGKWREDVAHDDPARHPAGDLGVQQRIAVRMVPVEALGMIGGDREIVLE